jgi:hypothetical protein
MHRFRMPPIFVSGEEIRDQRPMQDGEDAPKRVALQRLKSLVLVVTE